MTIVYMILKFIHIMSAIIAVGANVTYGVWNARMSQDPGQASFVLKSIKFIDDRIANPAYGVLLLTGLVMAVIGNWGFAAWIIVALILFVAIAVIGFGFFSPLLNTQIRLADSGEIGSTEFRRLANRSRAIGPILGLMVLVILGLMVFKPHL